MIKKIASVLLILLWMFIIFSFSGDTGETSGGLTEEIIVKVTTTLTDIKEGTKEMQDVIDKWMFPTRKAAHYFVYFVLAFLIMNTLFIMGVKRHTLIITGIICIFYAMSDEYHQTFVSGRTGQISDVLLDSSAALISAFLYHRFILMRFYREKKSN
ncbi:MAG: VanZ family protein [Bacilli bacterium]|nr:VanZ family protein [Bacilli bacterium]